MFDGADTDPVTGEKRYRNQYFRGGKREAQRQLAALVAEVDSGVVAPAAKTVATLHEEVARPHRLSRPVPTTLYGYHRLVAKLPDGFKALALKKVTPKVVDDLYRFLSQPVDRKPATVLRFHTALRAAFAQAVRWGWMDRNPIDRATPPRVNRDEVDPPTVEDVLRILERALNSRNPENALVFRLLAATGCRRGEVCALQWHDVNLDMEPVRMVIRRAVIEIERQLILQGTKTHAIRKVSLDEETSQLLREHRDRVAELAGAAGVPVQPTDFVFERAPGTGEPLPPSRISQAWQRLCKELGVKARLHDLRHLQASLLLDAGEAITTVAARLGHRDTATTLKVYGHLMPGADARAAGIVGSALSRQPKKET